jgi:hypothetical protein
VLRLDGALDGDRAPMGKSKAVSSHRSPRNQDPESHAKPRRREIKGRRRFSASSLAHVVQLPKTFCGKEGVLECSGLTELWMESSASMGKSKAVSSHRSPRNQDPESHAKMRSKGRSRFSVSSLAQVVQLPKTFFCSEGVLECSGLTELWIGIEHVDGKIQCGVKPPQSKKSGSGLDFWKMIAFAASRETPSPSA